MDKVFSPNKPKMVWSERQSTSEKDEQAGYHSLYRGAMLGIRNPVTHEFNWVEDAEVAIELLIFAQHLLRKAKCAQLVANEGLAGLLARPGRRPVSLEEMDEAIAAGAAEGVDPSE
jgi:hypothetical protein